MTSCAAGVPWRSSIRPATACWAARPTIEHPGDRQLAHLYGLNDKRHGDNLRNYHEYVRERDLCRTHAFGHPQINRSLTLAELPDPYTAVGLMDRLARLVPGRLRPRGADPRAIGRWRADADPNGGGLGGGPGRG